MKNFPHSDRKAPPIGLPNPTYPNGIDLDVSLGAPSCEILLPYPARRCGYYDVRCRRCGYRVAITTAGRPDDPRSVRVPCKRPMPDA